MPWAPSPELARQADLVLQDLFPGLAKDLTDAEREIEADHVMRGMLLTGQHLSEVRKRKAEIIQAFAEALLSDVLFPIRRLGQLNEESGAWASEWLTTRLEQICGGYVRSLADFSNRLGLPSAAAGAAQEEASRLFPQIKGRLHLLLEKAINEDKLLKMGSASAAVTSNAEVKELEQKFKILWSAPQAERDFHDSVSEVKVGSLLFVDVDHFKEINTRFTEATVDRTILTAIQHLLRQGVLGRGTAYRQGGEEFLVLLPNQTKPEAQLFAERLCDEVRATPFSIDEETVHTTVSVGVAGWPDDGGDFASVLQAANDAEHAAKKEGRDRVCVHGEVAARDGDE